MDTNIPSQKKIAASDPLPPAQKRRCPPVLVSAHVGTMKCPLLGPPTKGREEVGLKNQPPFSGMCNETIYHL